MIMITIETDDAAFADGDELPRVLRKLGAKIAQEMGDTTSAALTKHGSGKVLDTNGNTVARWENVPS